MMKKPKVQNSKPKIKENLENRNQNTSILFGVLPVLEKLRANPKLIDKILIGENSHEKRLNEVFTLAKQNGILISKVKREVLHKFVEQSVNHQGIIAFTASAKYVDADEILNEINENSLLVILDGIEDPRNFGAILRTCECAGVNGVFIPERRAVGLTETVAKSSAGATEYVKVAKVTNLNRLIEDLKKRNVWVVGTSLETSTDYVNWDWKQPTALVMGSEGKGLHRLVAENCDVLIKIPMLGNIQSLNVSVATGVLLFEAIRQRKVNNE
ncbi:MAG: 23S rRNA (guanosine(2251)-2'-O)-methyltransferase RlmB [Pyrinomonadaceae bacterium]|jgi:23S rRNA (guanosine2251-2'-O)-methyltransferase|nr:23S rRNA (guanosine(2251)-2'-O)-methyltransferase RlmB [Pyrinomonadaceae bacterium]